MIKYFWRLMCRVFGHPEPDVAVDKSNHLLIFCPRCYLIYAGDQTTFNKENREQGH